MGLLHTMERLGVKEPTKIIPFCPLDDGIRLEILQRNRLGFIEQLMIAEVNAPQDQVSVNGRQFLFDAFADNIDDVIKHKRLILPIKYFWSDYNLYQLSKNAGLTTQTVGLRLISTMIDVWQNVIPEAQAEQKLDEVVKLKAGDTLFSQREQRVKDRLAATSTVDTNDYRVLELISQRIGLSPAEKSYLERNNIHLTGSGVYGEMQTSPAFDLYVKWLTTDQNRYLAILKQYFIASVHEQNLHHPYQIKVVNQAEMPKKQGFIYVIKAEDRYKIGRSISKRSRIKTHQTSSPVEISLVFEQQVDDCVNMELELHDLFSDKRVKGEWFALDEKDLKTLSEYFRD